MSNKSKAKGTAFESMVVDYLRRVLDDERVERRTLKGANDCGDIAGLTLNGERVVIECKNHKRMDLAEWLDEAELERINDDAGFAFVAHKRKGCAGKHAGDTYVTMTLKTLAAILAGNIGLLWLDVEDGAWI